MSHLMEEDEANRHIRLQFETFPDINDPMPFILFIYQLNLGDLDDTNIMLCYDIED